MKVILEMMYFKDLVFFKLIINIMKDSSKMVNLMGLVFWVFQKITKSISYIKDSLQTVSSMVKGF